jgi:hypothetical protein
VAFPFQWGAHSKLLIAGSQSYNCGNKLAASVSTVGIFCCNSKEVAAASQYQYQPTTGSLLTLQITEPVSSGKCGKIVCYECE